MPFDDMSSTFGAVFGPLYRDGYLSRNSFTDNGKGTMTKAAPNEIPVKFQLDNLTQAQRVDGYAEDAVRVLILTDGLDQWLEDGRVADNDELTDIKTQATYRLASPRRDPVNTHWDCVGRLKPNQVP